LQWRSYRNGDSRIGNKRLVGDESMTQVEKPVCHDFNFVSQARDQSNTRYDNIAHLIK
jgi:hypothetical protein